MSTQESRLLELQSLICQAMADPKRLRILYALASGERSVGELADELGVSLANASQHLGVLRTRGLVRARREGNVIRYTLAYPRVMVACNALRRVLSQQLADEGKLSSLIGQHYERDTSLAGTKSTMKRPPRRSHYSAAQTSNQHSEAQPSEHSRSTR